MQPSVLSIGNATKDSYLEIQAREASEDQASTEFDFNLTFDDSSLDYLNTATVLGGVILSDRIFRAAHVKSFSSANEQGFTNFNPEKSAFPTTNRYIISHQGRSVVLNASPKTLAWVPPIYVPGMIYVAENNFSEQYLADFKNYITQNKDIRFSFTLNDFDGELLDEMMSRAEIVFVDLSRETATNFVETTSPESAIDSLADHGVAQVVVLDGAQIYVGDKHTIVRAEAKFDLNFFYQKSIFSAALIAEYFEGESLEENFKVALAVAENSDFAEIITPLIARQILNKKSNTLAIELLRHNPDFTKKLRQTAADMVARPKGIFAADESGGSIHKKFTEAGIEDTEESRRRYREMFFTTPDIENYLSGVILFEETVGQNTNEGQNFVEYLKNRNMLVGVKLDGGLAPLVGFEGETITKGLDALDEKLERYAAKGVDFAKWRVAFDISAETEEGRVLPTNAAIAANVQILARYAKACQEYGIVPIVEPEVVYDGAHSLDECLTATKRILHALFAELKLFGVDLAGTILKTNMVLSGKRNSHSSSPQEVAEYTAEALRSTVPEGLAGVVFLSGGQTVHQATDNLQAVTNIGPYPWGVTYSYARALQGPALEAWAGKDENLRQAQLAFLERVAANSHALYKA